MLALAACLAACSKPMAELYGSQTEAEANDMVLALRSHGITATKVSGKAGISVMTSDAEFAASVQVLTAAGLPRQKRPGVTDLFPAGKMFTTPAEESIRSRFALEQQIASDLQMIQGVRDAQVILALGEPVAHGPQTPSSASVMIIFDDHLEAEGLVPRVKLFVENSVPQLPAERISVVMFRAHYDEPAQPGPSQVAVR